MDMNCTRLETWLIDQPDANRGELPAEWSQHIAQCAACAQCWQDERLLGAAVVAWRTNSPCPPAADALVALLMQEVAPRRRTVTASAKTSSRSAWWPMLLASAALVVISIGLTQSLSPTSDSVAWQSSEQLALTSTVGTLLSRFEDTQDIFTVGQSGLPAIPSLPETPTRGAEFNPSEMIDPAAPSAVLRYGEPLGQGVGHAFRFLQIAVPVSMADAG